MKLPYFPFYPGDWKKDQALSLCTPSTRGIWIDLLCAMHESDRSGQITGTPEQLARLSRCTAVELDAALADFRLHRVADVTERDGLVTLVNRRMKREAKIRNQSRLRMARQRNKDPVTHHVTGKCPPSSVSSSVSVSEKQHTEPETRVSAERMGWPGRKPKDLDECLAMAQRIGLGEPEARQWYVDAEAAGWRRGDGTLFDNWPRQMCIHRDKLRSVRPGTGPGHSSAAETILRQTELKRVEDEMQRLRGQKPWTDADRAAFLKFRERRDGLLKLLGLPV